MLPSSSARRPISSALLSGLPRPASSEMTTRDSLPTRLWIHVLVAEDVAAHRRDVNTTLLREALNPT